MLTASSPRQFLAIDTSVWASSILPNDSNHITALNWIIQYTANGGYLVAPTLLVVEIAAAVARATGNAQMGHNAIKHLYAYNPMLLLSIDQSLVNEAADIAAGFRLRGSDALFVALARQLSIPLVSFDNEQLTRPTSIITTIRP